MKKSNSTEDSESIITLLRKTLDSHTGEFISFGNILDNLKDKGLALLIAIIALPISIPVPTPPGFTTLFGIPLCILTSQLIYRFDHPWLPKWLRDKNIKTSTFKGFVDKSEPFFLKLAKFLKPRHARFITPHSERIMGILALSCAVCISLPILFANAIPSAAILIMALSIIYRDGLAAVIGMILAVIGLLIAVVVVTVTLVFGMVVIEKAIAYTLIVIEKAMAYIF